ncbi:DUF418 domain-containing protein [Haloferula chungangensis]|uniref:DUF418 domain-containing protein n=1 Tax=Haloferula chungangensis TaxID=1048331 RepID=A0ABW2L160_9BACT
MKDRIIGFDLARAMALLGMIIVNYKLVMGAANNGSAWLVSLAGLLDGRAAATFVVLAGIGVSLVSGGALKSGEPKAISAIRNTLLKRALFLFVVGMLYTPLWPADILHFYGVYIAAGAVFLGCSTRTLSILGLLIVTAFVPTFFSLDYEREWNWKTLEYSGYWTPEGFFRNLFFNGFHPVLPWLAFFLLGMVVGRWDVTDPAIRRRLLLTGLLVALAAEGGSRLLIHTLSAGADPAGREALEAMFGTGPMPPMPLYMLAGAAWAVAVIALCGGIGNRCRNSRWIRPFVATGQLSLTLYVAHVIVGMGPLEEIGRLENQSLGFSLLFSFGFFAASVAFAWGWSCRFKRGPLEMFMSYLTAPRRAA